MKLAAKDRHTGTTSTQLNLLSWIQHLPHKLNPIAIIDLF